jgi:hypothetical protein
VFDRLIRSPIAHVALAALGAMALPTAPAQAANLFDPAVKWRTMVTPHFRVNYPAGYEAVAKKAAGYAEEAHEVLSPWIETVPANRTELTLLDNEDTVNGFGFPLPNNQIFVYLNSPHDDMPAWRYDAWLRDLLLHEYTHVLHLEKTAGLTAWVNRVFGRSYFPNMFTPIFLIEGLAVTTETKFSTGGRGRDAAYRMILREAALADKLAAIDRASGYYTIEYPGGELPYIYGMAFYRHLMGRFGDRIPVDLIEKIAYYPFFGLYGINESLKELTGEDAGQLWADMQAELKVDAAVQAEAIRELGPLTPLKPVTDLGMYQRHPVYTPDGQLQWAGWTGHSYGYLYGAQPNAPPKKIISKGIFGHYAYSPDGKWLYHTRNWDENRFTSYDDLFRWDVKGKQLKRLSHRARLDEPTVSPSGYTVAAVQSDKGQTNLVTMRADGSALKPLTHLDDFTQFSSPVWHPQWDKIATSAWHDGSRDLYLVDATTGEMTALWRDRDLEINPTWSPDGRYLVFVSDRTGVYNLYAYELETKKLFRMTNVMGGLLEPAVSPDMTRVAAVSYGNKGFDIVTMPWDPKTWTPVPVPASDLTIHQPLPKVSADAFPTQSYDPWPSLRPKVWAPFALTDGLGPILGVSTIAQDTLLNHFLYGYAGYGVMTGRPFYQVGYTNETLFPSLSAYAMDSTTTSFPAYQGKSYMLTQRNLFQGFSATFPGLPAAYLTNNWVTGDTLGFGLNFANTSLDTVPDPALPASRVPVAGQTNTLSVTYKYGDNYKFAYSISPEGGNLFTLGYEQAMPLLGSTTSFGRVWTDWRRYVPLPWAHHVLGLRLSGGATTGGQAAGNYYLGGYDSMTLLTNVDLRTASGIGSRQLPMRGYPFGAVSGPKAYALSAEYRFPIYSVQRGYGIYPNFIRNVHGALFTEAGQAWNAAFDWRSSLVSVGAELRAQTHFLQAPSEVRLGVGQGLVPALGVTPFPQFYADVGAYF